MVVSADIYFFFFQAEDGIRDLTVTGVQTCALPISGLGTCGALWPDLSVGEARAIAHATEVRIVLAAQELHVVRRHESAIRRLVLQLVHRHVLELLLAFQRFVAARADDALEL